MNIGRNDNANVRIAANLQSLMTAVCISAVITPTTIPSFQWTDKTELKKQFLYLKNK